MRGTLLLWMMLFLAFATVAAACFLITVFAMTKVVMMTTEGYPLQIGTGDLDLPKVVGIASFFLGFTSLSALIALSGWTKSKKTGIFTTIIGALTFIMMLLSV